MTIWFTSDHHFSHANILKYTNRPFADTDEMNRALVKNYKEKVKPTDQVYFLGDFAFGNHEKILRLLPGVKYLIRGNHDQKISDAKFLQWGFHFIKDVYELKLPNEKFGIWLSHYAHLTWPKKHFGNWHLFGHSHGKIIGQRLSADVGVDCWNYYPVSLEELKEFFKNKKIEPTTDYDGD